MRVYIDGVFDLFHRGHLESLRHAKFLYPNVDLVVGVVSDSDAESYKRKPIIQEEDRVEIVKQIKWVDHVICPCPLIVTPEFLQEHHIDLVVHGFVNDDDRTRQESFFEKIKDQFQEIPYYNKISTTDIIKRIKQ